MKMSKDEKCPEEWKKNIIDLGVQRETPGRRRTASLPATRASSPWPLHCVKMGKRKNVVDTLRHQEAKNGNISLATAYYTGKNIKVFSKTGGSVPTVLKGRGEASSEKDIDFNQELTGIKPKNIKSNY